MKTKQKIINQAIFSYNAYGLKNITSRDLAKSLNISHGNLEYHFNNKEALLIDIYKQMKAEISETYEINESPKNPFIHFNELLLQLEKLHKTYAFFNLDVLEIFRNFEKINALLNNTFQTRKEQIAKFIKLFITHEYLKKEQLKGSYYQLSHTIHILITFWNSQQKMLPYLQSEQPGLMSEYVWKLLIPQMTKKGFDIYQTIHKKNQSL